ncbi:MAG: stage II sporulation protein P [Lachnospiraceae bacterium]|nr:stage II sporulation protein P [Lachnospiraceae bacterium]
MIGVICVFVLFFSTQNSFSYMTTNLFVPVLIAADHKYQEWSLEKIILDNAAHIYPFWRQIEMTSNYTAIVEDECTYEKLLELEGTDEDREAYPPGETKEDSDTAQVEQGEETGNHTVEEVDRAKAAMENENMFSKLQMDNFTETGEKQVVYRREDLRDFQNLIKQFYTIDATTMTDESQLQIDKLLDADMAIQKSAEPQILIYHTHASECYVDSVPGDLSTTVMGVGEQLKKILVEKYGYSVLHDTGIYDTVRAQAYNVAAPRVEQLLAENPSIQVVIDLHRDQVQEGTKLVTSLNGMPTAKFMFFNGLSRTKETGDITYLANPNIDENLAFAFQMQLTCNEYYPDITRKIYLKGYRYNMQYKGKTLLIELGAQTNTVTEAKNACFPIAHALDLVLSGKMPDNS